MLQFSPIPSWAHRLLREMYFYRFVPGLEFRIGPDHNPQILSGLGEVHLADLLPCFSGLYAQEYFLLSCVDVVPAVG